MTEVGVDVADVDDDAVDDERRLEPLPCERAGLGVPARTLIGVARMPHQDRRAVEVEDDVGDRACTVVEALDLAEAEDFGDPLGRAARVFVREHRDHALLHLMPSGLLIN